MTPPIALLHRRTVQAISAWVTIIMLAVQTVPKWIWTIDWRDAAWAAMMVVIALPAMVGVIDLLRRMLFPLPEPTQTVLDHSTEDRVAALEQQVEAMRKAMFASVER